MIPLIQQAMVMGYTADKILSFLGDKIPNMKDGLSNAKNNGYSDEDILNFLKNKIPQKDPEGTKKYSNQLDTYLSANGIQTKEERTASKNKGIKNAIGVAATAIGSYKAYENYSGIFDQVKDYFKGKEGQTPESEPVQESKPKSLFEKLLGGVDVSLLDEVTQKRLKFLVPVAAQLEKEGKDEKHPAVKKLYRKIKDILKGKIGLVESETERFQAAYPQEQEQGMQQPQQQMQSPGQMQPQQPQAGKGQQALMAILQQIQAMRGNGG